MDITLLTYTNSKVSDLHIPYFDRIKRYFNDINHLVLSDRLISCDGLTTLLYSESDKYSEHMTSALLKLKTKYVIYSQEDYILFDYVDKAKINKLIQKLDDDQSISFIRLIYSGINFSIKPYDNELFYLCKDSEYFFSTQATIWKVEDLLRMFCKSKVETIWDEPKNSLYLKEMGKNGLCVMAKGDKIGSHYNSVIYPYIATAIVKGKWNYSEYQDKLDLIFSEYKIDKNIRGIR